MLWHSRASILTYFVFHHQNFTKYIYASEQTVAAAVILTGWSWQRPLCILCPGGFSFFLCWLCESHSLLLCAKDACPTSHYSVSPVLLRLLSTGVVCSCLFILHPFFVWLLDPIHWLHSSALYSSLVHGFSMVLHQLFLHCLTNTFLVFTHAYQLFSDWLCGHSVWTLSEKP